MRRSRQVHLFQQHQAGRRLTDTILKLAPQIAKPGADRQPLVDTMPVHRHVPPGSYSPLNQL
jgi:hypothetical protein